MNYIVGTIDLALITLYLFWAFFAALVLYLVREGMREGYPTRSEVSGREMNGGTFLSMPLPKKFLKRDGSEVLAPRAEAPEAEPKLEPTSRFTGSAMAPTGDPLADAVGPAAYTNRPDVPDMNHEKHVRIAPLSASPDFWLEERDPDPRGWPAICFDGSEAGTVSDVWIDRAEYLVRYIEVTLADGGKVLLPMNLAVINASSEIVQVRSVNAEQFARAPRTKAADQITLLEEDKIQAYFTGGTLYATASRAEPIT
ncbi:MAG: photosynthetic reaction center subunit H [Pseudomonadota bacterium]